MPGDASWFPKLCGRLSAGKRARSSSDRRATDASKAVPAEVVLDFLAARFQRPSLLPVVAATAAASNAELLTCDRRASAVYERGVRVFLLSSARDAVHELF